MLSDAGQALSSAAFQWDTYSESHHGGHVGVLRREGKRAGEVATFVYGVLGSTHHDLPFVDVVIDQAH